VAPNDASRAQAEAAWVALRDAAEDAENMFDFARALRAWPWPENVEAEDVATYIERVYKNDCRLRGRKLDDVWSLLDRGPSGDPRADFIDAWERVRMPAGKTIWEVVVENVARLPFVPLRYRSQKYQTFVSFAGHLQRVRRKGQHIMLPVKLLAKILEVTPRMISTYRRWAIADGILTEEVPSNRENRRATEFRFHLDRFDGDRRQRSH
jgi:hypothetical protein